MLNYLGKHFLWAVICSFSLLSISSDAADQWLQKTDFGGMARRFSVGFPIGDKFYLGTGFDDTNGMSDFWEYDPSSDHWTQKANCGGGVRYVATSFSIGTKGYICSGLVGGVYAKDLWEFDPSSNTWTQKANFPGNARSGAVAFAIGDKAYVGSGRYGTSYYNDFYEYNPSTNTWTQKADFPGIARSSAVAFSINGKGYMGTGYDGANFLRDFWEYDPTSNSWAQKASLGSDGSERYYAVGFSIGSRGFLGMGSKTGLSYDDLWEYSPSENAWTQKTAPGGYRNCAVAGPVGSKGYFGTGKSGVLYRDFWQYSPTPLSRTVTFQTQGGGSIGGVAIQQVEDGGACSTVTAVRDDYRYFKKWMKDGTVYSTSPTITVTNVASDMTLTAMFSSPIFVKSDATGSNDGSSWTDAFVNLQPAIDAAESGDEVWVAKGTYVPTSWPNMPYPFRELNWLHFSLKNGVTLYGGFAGNETNLNQRDIKANESICSGDIGYGGYVEHVFYHPEGLGLNNTAILDGFVIKHGHGGQHGGGGIYNNNSSPTIVNCTITDNTASIYGGGIYNYNASPIIKDCNISGNSAGPSDLNGNGGTGGGIYNYNSSPVISGCTISYNTAYGGSAGLFFQKGSPCISNSTIVGNHTWRGGAGGGIYLDATNSALIMNCTVSDNIAGEGAGIYMYSASSTIVSNSIIWNNSDPHTPKEIYNILVA